MTTLVARPQHAGPLGWLDRLVRNPQTGEVVVVQRPNLPLAIALAAIVARRLLHPAGAVGTAVAVVGAVALVWWAVAEIGWGASLFRRLLGAAVLVGTAAAWTLGR